MPRKRESIPWFRRNALSLVAMALFALTLVGNLVAGHRLDNQERAQHGLPAQPLLAYARSEQFLSSVLENWESEFLQMGLFVVLTVRLRQRGSAESRPFDARQEKKKQETFPVRDQPWPVRRGGWARRVYRHSLSLALFALFLASFAGHFHASLGQHNAEQAMHGLPATSIGQYLQNAEFWFQSMQNWQSEFLAVFSLVVLSIWLREDKSPQSKQLDAPHAHTGH